VAQNSLTPQEMRAVKIRDAVIGKWGADTISMFEENVKTDRPIDRLCITTLSVCSTYCKAIMTLLEKGWRMPAKALLRVLFEANAKIIWCLAERQADEPESAVEERIERWAKASLEQDIKLRRDFLDILSGDEKRKLQGSLTKSEATLDQWDCDPMPKRFTTILGDIGNSWKGQFYPQLYRQFNNAVHLDFGSLCSRARDDGMRVSVTNDSDEPIEALAQYCVVNMHVIFFAIRSNYGWNSDAMNKEFKELKESGTV